MLLPLITLPYLIRVLGFSNYGIVILAASLVAYFQSITDYSFKITATRDVAVFRDSPEKLNLIYSKVLMVKGIFLCLSFLLLFAIVMLYPPFYEERRVFFLTMPILLGYSLFPEWFFQGIEKMKYISILNISIKLFFTICVFVFIKKQEDYWIYPLLQSAGFIGAGLVGQYILVKKYRLKFRWLRFRIINNSIKDNFPIFINQFLPTMYSNTTVFLIGILLSTSLLGIYDAIKKIIYLEISVVTIMTNVFFPYLNRKKDHFIKVAKIILFCSIITIIAVLASRNFVFLYLDIHSIEASWVLFILNIGVFFISLYHVFGTNYFIVNRKDKIVMGNTVTASIIGFVLAYPLIESFGIIGAAINVTLSQGIMGITLFFEYLKHRDVSKNFKL